jgi:hypothetical protein
VEAVGTAATGKARLLRTLAALERLRRLIDQQIEHCVP